jgi:carboxyl-terminal processing protease
VDIEHGARSRYNGLVNRKKTLDLAKNLICYVNSKEAKLATLLIIIALSSFAAGFTSAQSTISQPLAGKAEKFNVFWEAWQIVKRESISELPDPKEMTYGAIRGVLSLLSDPYTTLVEPNPRSLEKDEHKGRFGGIGVRVEKRNGSFALIPEENSPAMHAGIQEGDIIISVDDERISPDMSKEDVLVMIRGPIGSSVRLEIKRPGEESPLFFEIIREEIKIPSVTYSLLEEGIGYVDIDSFNERTSEELEEALRSLQNMQQRTGQRGIMYLILDLRDNHGGLLEAAIDVASLFLSTNPLHLESDIVLYERSKKGERAYPVRGKALTFLRELPIVVLVNGGTASASEIVAGALKEHGRALLLGERTFGKGSVQLIFDLSDGSSLHVTSSLWLTPKRNSIEGCGLSPDITVSGTEEQLQSAIAHLLSMTNDQ